MAFLKNPIFVIGRARHGKTEVRKVFADRLGVLGGSCSDVIYSVWSIVSGHPEQFLRGLPKEQSRGQLIALGDWLTTPSHDYEEFFPYWEVPHADTRALIGTEYGLPRPGFLIQNSLSSGVWVLDGMRRYEELGAALYSLSSADIHPTIVWVERTNAPEGLDNLSIPKRLAHHTIVNDGSIEELREKALRLSQALLNESK